MGGFNAVPHSYGEKRMTVMSVQSLREKSHRTGYGTFSLSESRESLLAMPSGENEDEVNVFIKSKDQREPAHFGLARKHLYLYEHQIDGDT